jgi:hypothetical protein
MLLTLVLFHFVFLILAALTFGHVELFALALVIGVVVGYLFRAAIASEITKFKLATIVTRLETAAKNEETVLRTDVTSVIADLKSQL